MPYPNEHSARLLSPDTPHIRVRRTDGSGDGTVQGVKIPTTIAVIWYITKKDGKEVPLAQALRFPVKKWTASEAKQWLKKNEIKYQSFEEASGEADSVEPDSQIERRAITLTSAEMRIEDEERPKLVGYAAKFGIWADLSYFREKIRAGAFAEVLKTSDTRCLKNHNVDLLLGRESSKTLILKENTVGLHYENHLPDTTVGRDIVEEIRRGDLNGCSFSFRIEEGDDRWEKGDDGKLERTILRIARLFDVGPVTYPAYEDTTVALRSLDRFCGGEITNVSTFEDVLKNPEVQKLLRANKSPQVSAERQRQIGRDYRKAERIIDRCRSAIARSVLPGQGSGSK